MKSYVLNVTKHFWQRLNVNRNTLHLRGNCTRVIAMSMLFLSFFFLQGCDKLGNGIGSRLGIAPPPPISVTFRESLLKGYVLQLHNRSDRLMIARVYVENKQRNQSTTHSVKINPNDSEELGVLEMDWTFIPGENGYISVDGYQTKVHFEISEGGRYRVW